MNVLPVTQQGILVGPGLSPFAYFFSTPFPIVRRLFIFLHFPSHSRKLPHKSAGSLIWRVWSASL